MRDNWCKQIQGNPFHVVQEKMKNLKRILTNWSKEIYGNIFQKVATLEDIIRVKEIQLEINSSEQNRKDLLKAEEDLMKHYQIEKEYWKQKGGMKWFKDGDRNTKFFHSYVRGRRIKLA